MTGFGALCGDWLPADWRRGAFVGRVARAEGPAPVLIVDGIAHDMARVAPTVSELLARRVIDPLGGEQLSAVETLVWLSPIDLQCVKAAGVTFAVSALERVIEERARGDAATAATIRNMLATHVGGDLRSVTPGSPEADELKANLIACDMWSQYLEVAIGPDAEIFTKAPVLSSVGSGAPIGVRSDSTWNNPEPEIVLVVDKTGVPVGATLGNDVNLRDFEGRSALLLGKAKDNNASCAIGPLIRLFDDDFTLDDIRSATVDLTIEGVDGYRLAGSSSMALISRDPVELVQQVMSEHHYPDGFVLFLGTMFAPVQDRDTPGLGFTHKEGDVVTISSKRLGKLVNSVTSSENAPAWSFGIGDLMRNLASRGLLTAAPALSGAVN